MKTVKLGDVVKIKNGRDYKHLKSGIYPVYGTGGIINYVEEYVYNKPTVLIPRKGSLDKVYYLNEPFWNVDTIFHTEINEDLILPKYLYYVLDDMDLNRLNTAGGIPSLTQTKLNKIKIPLPSLEEQEKIVSILNNIENLISLLEKETDLRKKQFEYYLRKTFKQLENQSKIQLKEVATLIRGKQINKQFIKVNGKFPYYNGGINPSGYTDNFNITLNKVTVSEGGASAGFVNFISSNFWAGSDCFVIDSKESYSNRFIYYFLKNNQKLLMNRKHGAGIPHLSRNVILNLDVPSIELKQQYQIVNSLDTFTTYISLLEQEIKLRQKQLEYYRNKLLTE